MGALPWGFLPAELKKHAYFTRKYVQSASFSTKQTTLPEGTTRILAFIRGWPEVNDVIFGSVGTPLTAQPGVLISFPFRYRPESFLENGRRVQAFLRQTQHVPSRRAFKGVFLQRLVTDFGFLDAGILQIVAFTTSTHHNS